MKILWALLPVLALVGVMGVKRTDDERQLQIVGGRTTISFFPSILEANSLKVVTNPTSEGDASTGEQSYGFRVAKSDLKFTLIDGRLKRFDGGGLVHSGGFTLTSGRNAINAASFGVRTSKATADGLQFAAPLAKQSAQAFDLINPRTTYNVQTKQFSISSMDLVISLQGAQQLGRPELAGQLVGMLSVYGDCVPVDGGGDVHVPEIRGSTGDAPIDVAISAMGSLTSLGRAGTFPNGRSGLSMSTTSCNMGTGNINWFAPMNVNHPVIAMNLYRINNGRFEQVGWSWLKHGFLATNSPNCGTCQSPGTGTMLGPGCSDTYGTGNNGDRFYLGGRDEVNAFTGVWTCTNSWFSNFQNDCVRRNPTNPSGLDAVDHRLDVLDQDMGNTGAQYFYEAYYINANDFDKYNNIASRGASMSWNGNTWAITTTSAQVQGPAINRWGDMRSTATPQNEGDVIVAVQVTDLGGGMHHYEYAVYNHDLDRQVREFSIPMPNGATVQNIGFRDIDRDANNQWSGAYANGKVTWSTGVFGSGGANPLKYSSVFNFRFDANVPAMGGSATLGLFKPGTGTSLAAASKVPLAVNPVDSYQVVNGAEFSGNLLSIAASDNNRLELGPTGEGSRSGTGIIASMTAPDSIFNTITLGLETSNTLQPTPGATQSVHLWNWVTSAWELIDTRATTMADTIAVISVSGNVNRFVNGTSREVRAKIIHTAGAGETGNRWRMTFDLVGLQFN